MATQVADKKLAAQLGEALEEQRRVELGALAQIGELQGVLQIFLQHESLRLEERLGADHPQVRSLATASDDNLAQIAAVNGELEVGRIRVPPAAEDEARVDGLIRDPQGRGIAGLTVCLVDRYGEALAGVDAATTDRSGYYALRLTKEMVSQHCYRGRTPKQVFLAVFNPREQLLQRRKQPLELVEGARLTVGVTLDRGDRVGPVHAAGPQADRPAERGKNGVGAAAQGEATEGAAAGEETDREGQGGEPLGTLVEALQGHADFDQIGASARKLRRHLEALKLDSRKAVAALAERADREVRDALKLPSLRSARAFKRILGRLFKERR